MISCWQHGFGGEDSVQYGALKFFGHIHNGLSKGLRSLNWNTLNCTRHIIPHQRRAKLCQRINWALFCLQRAVYNAGCIIPYAAICYRAKQAPVFLGRMMQFISTEVHYELWSFASITCQSTPWPRLLICVHPYIIGQLKEFHNFIIKELKKANKTEQIYKGTFSLLNKLMLYVRAPLAAPVVPV